MNKIEALEKLKVNNTQLAKILGITKQHLSRVDELSYQQAKIVNGYQAVEILKNAVITIERLENEQQWIHDHFPEILDAAKNYVKSLEQKGSHSR